ncbi:DUF881 domain-containing protein [Cellulomonas sp. APG4]|uniref:DUF881 domain-containing protein n=1 Tax=Cellulomonas sp. APG4 TaxID=1538656 RepID=UPI00137A78BF|nr:DUF881 domain-containing protein [Cellulomonas sp. APG4]NCT90748.1 DUF881 domain-containing protein [Cellulomonas sp. APG4]
MTPGEGRREGAGHAWYGPVRAGGTHAAPAVDASMSLLNEVMYRPVDTAYAEAAERPRVERSRAARVRRATVHLVLAAALGALTVSAISALRTPPPEAVSGRALLREQIEERSAAVSALQEETGALSAEIADLQEDAVAAENPELFAQLTRTELVSGAVAVQGPGLEVVLDDTAGGDTRTDPLSRVQALDLQVLVNGLWSAGAEAIAINGERLTALSAIRGAGQAVLVDLAPVLPPYRVEAVGDVRALQTGLARSGAQSHLMSIAGTYDIDVTVRAVPELLLPGAGSSRLRFADLPDDAPLVPDGTSTAADVEQSAPPDGGTP